MPSAIELAPDLYPVDPVLRRLSDRVMAKVATFKGSRIGTNEDLVHWLTPWWAKPSNVIRHDAEGRALPKRQVGAHAKSMAEALPGLVEALADAGHFSYEGGRLRIAVPVAYAAAPLPRDRLLAAFAGRMAARRVEGEDRQAVLARAFLNLRGLHALHRTDDGSLVISGRSAGVRAFLIPAGYRIDPSAGPVIKGGHLVMVDRKGAIAGRWVPGHAISTSFPEPERAVVAVDGKRLRGWKATGFGVGDLVVTAVRSNHPIRRMRNSDHPRTRKPVIEPTWKGVEDGRGEASAYLGFDMGVRHWKSFCGSLRRSRRLSPHVGRLVLGLVDPEVRKACLRSPRATVALANWFVSNGPTARHRRLQASAAYPVLTPFLHHAVAEIDAGRPLAPVLSAKLGLPPVLVRHLAGCPWQRMGKAFDRLVTTRERAGRLSYAIGVIPPERLPTTKEGWVGLIAGVTLLVDHLGFPSASRLTRDASLDWQRTANICAGNLSHALDALASVIRDACAHATRPAPPHEHGITDGRARMRWLVTRAAVGRDGGLGRLAKLDERFHRNVARLRSEHDEIRREGLAVAAAGEEVPPESWLPLTAAAFRCGRGAIEWITDSAGLAKEGEEQSHCVAWRDRDCRYGRAHVGRVTGADGGRSTVEFHLASNRKPQDGSVYWTTGLTEHQGKWNRTPAPDCEAVVQAFLADAGKLVDSGPIIVAGDAYARWDRLKRGVSLPPAYALRILRLYEGLLDPSYRGLPIETWIGLVEEAQARRLPAVPETCTLGNQADQLLIGGPRQLDD